MEQAVPMPCFSCGEPGPLSARLRCGRCRLAWYCGAECQRAGWPQHRANCIRAPLHSLGATVRTRRALDADVDGKALPAGTSAVIHELPHANGGLYSIAVGCDVYDVAPDEIEDARALGTSARDARWAARTQERRQNNV